MKVTLNASELQHAAFVGCRRQIEAMCAGRQHIAGFDGIGWDLHIEGACGELAVAKALNVHWGGAVNTFKLGDDVEGAGLQVRTRSKHGYELLVRPGDAPDAAYVHVTGVAPDFVVHGWLFGREAQQPEFLQTYGGRPKAYFVHPKHLRPLDDLALLLTPA